MSDTGDVPPVLRSRIALIVLLGAFLIPIVTSSLRGLTHVLTCDEEAQIPFTVVVPETGDPTIVSSRAPLTRGEAEGVCGGLVLDMAVGAAGPGKINLRLPITNNTDFDWHGTVRLKLGETVVPVDIGSIPSGETGTDTVAVNVSPGELEVDGSLLIGP